MLLSFLIWCSQALPDSKQATIKDIKHESFQLYDGPRKIAQKKLNDLLYLCDFLTEEKQVYYKNLTGDGALDSEDASDSEDTDCYEDEN